MVRAHPEWLGDLPHAVEVRSHMTFSFYPHATRHGLRIVLAVAAVFAVVLNVYRRPEQIVRLLAVIAAGVAVMNIDNGFGAAFLAFKILATLGRLTVTP